ncbi:hypothetical protein ACIRRA_30940 [Nocardia sp. NPDC101769]|uniref:hypothetical protein n=1 Tax=Nocardia sp. NPDC101769 TaxID=3364333 RepID=UPI0038157C6F
MMSLLALFADAALCVRSGGLAALGRTPVLMIADDGVRSIPRRCKTHAASTISGVQLVILPTAGHLGSKPDDIDWRPRGFITSLDPLEGRARA